MDRSDQSEITQQATLQARAGRGDAEPQMVPADYLGPMMAGARARGIADAYEMMQLGVILLDASGRVLFASERAKTLMHGAISIVSDHMVGANPELNAAIGGLIAGGLGESLPQPAALVVACESGRGIGVRLVPVPPADERSVQLLQAVVVVSAL